MMASEQSFFPYTLEADCSFKKIDHDVKEAMREFKANWTAD
jgi:hypothetical protein